MIRKTSEAITKMKFVARAKFCFLIKFIWSTLSADQIQQFEVEN